ncbi:unnamed protein product [Lampetra planeri]
MHLFGTAANSGRPPPPHHWTGKTGELRFSVLFRNRAGALKPAPSSAAQRNALQMRDAATAGSRGAIRGREAQASFVIPDSSGCAERKTTRPGTRGSLAPHSSGSSAEHHWLTAAVAVEPRAVNLGRDKLCSHDIPAPSCIPPPQITARGRPSPPVLLDDQVSEVFVSSATKRVRAGAGERAGPSGGGENSQTRRPREPPTPRKEVEGLIGEAANGGRYPGTGAAPLGTLERKRFAPQEGGTTGLSHKTFRYEAR